MTGRIKTIRADTLQDFLDAIFPTGSGSSNKYDFFIKNDQFRYKDEGKEDTEKTDSNKDALWFRGQSNHHWLLQPSLYRRIKDLIDTNQQNATIQFWEELTRADNVVLEEFKVRNYHLLEGRPYENNYLWLSLMQHNGMATRFLDWSEQAITALFFSLEKYFYSNELKKENIPCVWVLKPHRLKFHAIQEYNKMAQEDMKSNDTHQNFSSLLDMPSDKIRSSLHNTVPLPVLSPYNHKRIQAQSGVFTIFPREQIFTNKENIYPWEFCLEKFTNAHQYLLKILITSPKYICEQMKSIGLKRSLFFPEIPNVSTEIEENLLRETRFRV